MKIFEVDKKPYSGLPHSGYNNLGEENAFALINHAHLFTLVLIGKFDLLVWPRQARGEVVESFQLARK